MKAQWDYRGNHAQKRMRIEERRESVVGKLAMALAVMVFVSVVAFLYEHALAVHFVNWAMDHWSPLDHARFGR